MKIIQTLKNALPVSRKAHQEALAKAHHAHASDSAYLTGQLKQVTAANIRLERKLLSNKED